jgi:hypothetical protein
MMKDDDAECARPHNLAKSFECIVGLKTSNDPKGMIDSRVTSE